MYSMKLAKKLFGLLLIAQVSTCFGGTPNENENFFVKTLMPAADEVDGLFTGKRGKEIFAINSSIAFKKNLQKAVEKLLNVMANAPGDKLKAELAKLKDDGVLTNWSQAIEKGWVEAEPNALPADQKKFVGNIMTIYAGNTQRPLASKISRLIQEDYLVLKELAQKIDGLFASTKFGLNADMDTKLKIRAAIDSFIGYCMTYKGLASEALKNLTKHELFACWDMATNGTGWLDVERDGWKVWKDNKDKAEAYKAVNNGIGRIMQLYLKDKTLLTTELNKIFLIVREVLVGKARLVEIAAERENITAGGSFLDADLKLIDQLMPKTQDLDEALGVITMNASRDQKTTANTAVKNFVKACEDFVSGAIDAAVIKNLATDPIIESWNKTKAIGSWYALNVSGDKTTKNKIFAAWKETYPKDYKDFGKAADRFMSAYSKSKKAMQNLVKSAADKAKKGAVPGDAKTLDAEKKKLIAADLTNMQKLAKWDVPAFKLPDIKTELLPEEKRPDITAREKEEGAGVTPGRGEGTGEQPLGDTDDDEERVRHEKLSPLSPVEKFAWSMSVLAA